METIQPLEVERYRVYLYSQFINEILYVANDLPRLLYDTPEVLAKYARVRELTLVTQGGVFSNVPELTGVASCDGSFYSELASLVNNEGLVVFSDKRKLIIPIPAAQKEKYGDESPGFIVVGWGENDREDLIDIEFIKNAAENLSNILLLAAGNYLGQYTDWRLIKELSIDHNFIKPEGTIRNVSVIFLDIEGSTNLVAAYENSPEIPFAIFNEYFTRATKHLTEAFLTRYGGDSTVALFNALKDTQNPTAKAVFSALKIRDEFNEYNEHRRRLGLSALMARIGIGVGKVVVGKVGSQEKRWDFTGAGLPLNLAKRYQESAESGEVWTDDKVIEACRNEGFPIRVGQARERHVKGLTKPIKIYPVIGFEDESKVP